MAGTEAPSTQGSDHRVDHRLQAPPAPLPAGFARNPPPGPQLSLQDSGDLHGKLRWGEVWYL